MPRNDASDQPKTAVRERLLDTADTLFYKEGIRAVGIDRVLAEADAAKASLYSHFRCKDDLVAAHIEYRAAAAQAQIEAYVADIPPSERAVRFFDFVIEWAGSPDFRGCPLQHVTAELCDREHPARKAAAKQRNWMRARFLEWATAAGVANPSRTADALIVLLDGAAAASEQDGPQRARDARWMAEILLSQ